MTATTTTTIRGVSIFSRQRTAAADVFDLALSPEGIAIRRPGRVDQHMTWDRISEWDIAERPAGVVLTLRGGGSVTPLLVRGWTLDDLGTVIREAIADSDGSRRCGGRAGADEGRGTASHPGPRRCRATDRARRPPRRPPSGGAPPTAAQRLEAARGHRPAGRRSNRGGPGAAAERGHHQLGIPRPDGLTPLRIRRAPPQRGRPRSRRSHRRGSAPGGTRRRDGCRASPRAAGRTRRPTWGRPASRAPSVPRRAHG